MPETWAVLLDGLIGAILGGAVTAWAVLYTLHRDGRRSQGEALEAATTRLSGEAWNMFHLVAYGKADTDAYGRFLAAATDVIVRSAKEHPEYGDTIKALATDFAGRFADLEDAKTISPKDAAVCLSAIQGATGRFLARPKDFKTGRATAAEFLRTAVPKE